MARKQTIKMVAEVPVDDLARQIVVELSDEAILKLFKDVDQMMGDWGFTKKVHAYFDKEMKRLEILERDGPA